MIINVIKFTGFCKAGQIASNKTAAETQLLYYFTFRLESVNSPPPPFFFLPKVDSADMNEHFMVASNFARSSVSLEVLICFINSGDKATQER